MWVSTSECGNITCYSPDYNGFEYYCFFGNVPVLRRMDFDEAPNYPPDQWNPYGQYLWWWVPTGVLQNSTINVFGVPMTRTSTNPYTFTATPEPAGLFFSKLWFDNDGYMTAFSAKDSNTGLDIDPERSALYYKNLTTVDGFDSYRNTMERATPAEIEMVDLDGDAKTDIALYRQGIGAWYFIKSSTNTLSWVGFGGDPSDIPLTTNPYYFD